MKWLIISVVMMSLIGSVMWVMPTPRQRFQAQLRLRARQLGFQVQLVKLELPRATGEMEGESISVPVYRLPRHNLSREQKERWVPWTICRVSTLATAGLPEGWSWIRGEGRLSPAALESIAKAISELPDDVVAMESTPIHLSVFWNEGEGQALEQIKRASEPLLEARV